MNWLSQLFRRVAYLSKRKQHDADLAEEMRLHLELRAAENASTGASPSEASHSAHKNFGNYTRLKEKSREAWGWGWLDSLAQDLRYGWRNLKSSRGFTITAILSLALGIGANTAIFSIMNALMLRSLPISDPHRLASVDVGGNSWLTVPLWESIRDHQNAFSGMFAYNASNFDLAKQGEKRIVNGLWVSGDFFNTLGVPPFRGRVFNREDDLHGGGKFGPVAVISHAFWQTEYGGASDVLGKSVSLNGHPFEIVGITPPSFRGMEPEHSYSVAIPLGCEPIFDRDGNALTNRSWWWLRIAGRLNPGITIDQATKRMEAVAPAIMQETLPEWDAAGKTRYLKNNLGVKSAANGFSGMASEGRVMIFAMMAVVAMVLLIACANIANLLLARAAARMQEISVRLAIGAGRRRLIRQLLTESVLLAALGIPGGMLLGLWGSRVLARLLTPRGRPLEVDVSMDTRVLLFTIGISLLTGLIFGLVPALRATRVSTNEVLKQTTRGSGGSASRMRLGRALVAGQVALSLALLVIAGLFITTLRNLWAVELGFDHHNVYMIEYDSRGHVPKEQRHEHYEQILQRLAQTPGVISAASTFITPISGGGWNGNLVLENSALPDSSSPEDGMTWFNRVSPGFFETLKSPILMGRDFSDRDRLNMPKVVILGEKTARDLFGNESPIGKHVRMNSGPGENELYEIIGVAPDSKYLRINEENRRTAYVPMAQDKNPGEGRTFLIRIASSNFDSVRPAIAAAIAEIAPQSSMEFKSLEHQVNNSLGRQQVVAGLISFFGVLALLLAVIGLYGVTAYAAAQRKGEIGIRMALGAQRGSVIWLVLRDVAIILAIGSVAGIAMSFGAGKLIGSLMFGVKPGDPLLLLSAALILATAGAIAGLVPALRASKLDPAIALRYE